MEKEEQIRVLKLLMKRLDDDTKHDAAGLLRNPAQIYTCPDLAARAQIGAESGFVDQVLFGRNEPALHHYHNTYRKALGMEPLELIPA